ncbi:glycoside hydrolase family 3 protein [Brachybacterium huguangmaarense]
MARPIAAAAAGSLAGLSGPGCVMDHTLLGSPDGSRILPSRRRPHGHGCETGRMRRRVRVGELVASLDADALASARVGGVFLLGRWESAGAVRSLLDDARTAASGGIAPLFAVDQEGGQVRMLRGDAARSTDSAEDLAARGPDAVRDAYRAIGEDLMALGIPLDLAPVADVVDPGLGDANTPVGRLERGFGTDPEAVSRCVEAALDGLGEAGALGTLKHVPGIGGIEGNPDFSADGVVDEDISADLAHLEPFRRGIEAGAPAVMVSSGIYPRLDPDAPAMFSGAVVTDLLRGALGFTGLVMTDDVGAAAAVRDVPVGQRATRFLDAGGDLVLTANPALAGELVDALVEHAATDPEREARVRESAERVLRLKERAHLL